MRRRSFATLMVLWVAAIAGVVMAAVQATSFAQASAGREALARVRAAWAARSGVELAIARGEFFAQNPDSANSYALFDDLSASGDGKLQDAAFRLSYSGPDGDRLGVVDANARINVNLMTAEQLALLPDIPEDGPDSILDWRDADDDTRPLGAERGYYLSRKFPYIPRNGPVRSMGELELIIGLTPELVRGEDWDLNGRLDPNEDDSELSWPPDNGDGVLDQGLSGVITTASTDGGMGATSGLPRLDLTTASAGQVAQRVLCDATQAAAIVAYGASSGATMSAFIQRDLRQLAQTGGMAGATTVRALERTELGAVLNECSIGPTAGKPGKLNINTCDAKVLQYLPEISATLADAIIYERAGRPEGFASVADLLDVPSMSRNRLARISNLLDVRSNAIIVSSRGRDARTGIEVEVFATVDLSTLPATITEYRVQ